MTDDCLHANTAAIGVRMINAPFSRAVRPPFGPGLFVSTGPVTLVFEQFAAPDGTDITGRSPAPTNTPGTTWTERLGNWSIASGKAVLAASQALQHATCNPGVADCTISDLVDNRTTNNPATNDGGVVARWSDASNYWRIGINAQANIFRITERNATTETVRASASLAIDPGTVYAVSAVLSGATITATLDGANQISYGSATFNQTATVHGFCNRTTTCTIDDWKVTVP